MTPEESQAIAHSVTAAKSYADIILKPPLEQIGGILSDSIGLWRLKNQVRVMLKAKTFLEAKGIKTPKRLEPNIVVPLLEGASYTEDEMLSDMFARLLSAHADENRQSEVHPSFAKVLGQLSHQDIVILNLLDELQHEAYRHQRLHDYHLPVRLTKIIDHFGYDACLRDANVMTFPMNNLERLGLYMEGQEIERTIEIFISPYGAALLIACHDEAYWRREVWDGRGFPIEPTADKSKDKLSGDNKPQ